MCIRDSASAALIATGIVIPLGVGGAGLTNFAGYVLWCLWLIAMAVLLWRPRRAGTPMPDATTDRHGRAAQAASGGVTSGGTSRG